MYNSASSKAVILHFYKPFLQANSRGSAPWTPGGALPLHPTRSPKAGPWTPPVLGFAPRCSWRATHVHFQFHWGNYKLCPPVIKSWACHCRGVLDVTLHQTKSINFCGENISVFFKGPFRDPHFSPKKLRFLHQQKTLGT